MVTINYQLIDTFENYKEFESVEHAVAWIQSIGEDMFQYVDLTDDKENYVEGYSAILKAFNDNNDLWHGDAGCIHLHTTSGHGGGQVCATCGAWFCY